MLLVPYLNEYEIEWKFRILARTARSYYFVQSRIPASALPYASRRPLIADLCRTYDRQHWFVIDLRFMQAAERAVANTCSPVMAKVGKEVIGARNSCSIATPEVAASLRRRGRRGIILGDGVATLALHLVVDVLHHVAASLAVVVNTRQHFLQRHIQNVIVMQLAVMGIAGHFFPQPVQ